MASVVTATDPTSALLALGGFRDSANMVAALAAAAGLTFETVLGGATLAASKVAIILDGNGVTLPGSASDGALVVIANAVPAVSVTVTPSGSDTVGGLASTTVGTRARGFKYVLSSTNWLIL